MEKKIRILDSMRIWFLALTIIILAACDKEDGPPPFSDHCNGLVNEFPIPGDNGNLFIVTGFTPNGDGINDVYKVFGQNLASVSVKIYNDAGTVLTTITQLNTAWDAGLITTGTRKYYFRAEAVTNQGRKIGICGELFALACAPSNFNTLNFEDELTPNGFTGVTAEQLQNCN